MKFMKALAIVLKKEKAEIKDIESLTWKDLTFRKTNFHLPKGIYFKCVQCGNCCTNDIPLDQDEVDSGFFETKEGAEFSWSFTNKFIKKETHDKCPYYKDGCSIYDKRPTVCKKYPMEHSPRSMGKPFTEYTFIIDKLETGIECNGFHLGKTRPQHVKQFIRPLKKSADCSYMDDKMKEDPELLEKFNKSANKHGMNFVKENGKILKKKL